MCCVRPPWSDHDDTEILREKKHRRYRSSSSGQRSIIVIVIDGRFIGIGLDRIAVLCRDDF